MTQARTENKRLSRLEGALERLAAIADIERFHKGVERVSNYTLSCTRNSIRRVGYVEHILYLR